MNKRMRVGDVVNSYHESVKTHEDSNRKATEAEARALEAQQQADAWAEFSSKYYALPAETRTTIESQIYGTAEPSYGTAQAQPQQGQFMPSPAEMQAQEAVRSVEYLKTERQFDQLRQKYGNDFLTKDKEVAVLKEIRATNYNDVEAHLLKLYGAEWHQRETDKALAAQAEQIAKGKNAYQRVPQGAGPQPQPAADPAKMTRDQFQGEAIKEIADLNLNELL
jgi:hypothetical protein